MVRREQVGKMDGRFVPTQSESVCKTPLTSFQLHTFSALEAVNGLAGSETLTVIKYNFFFFVLSLSGVSLGPPPPKPPAYKVIIAKVSSRLL